MSRLILILAIGLAAWIIYVRIKAMPPAKRRGAYLRVGLGALVLIVTIGVATGRMHWLGAAITGLLVGLSRLTPVLLRLTPLLQLWKQHGPNMDTGGGSSEVESRVLKMTLDHGSGDISGTVLEGEFEGRQLDELDRTQLDALLAYCQGCDMDSARLLESYLERRFGDGFESTTPPPATAGHMTESEALAILGLESNASRDDIVKAHRSLMQKLHPDRGGNDYLAAKLNQAKDFLLG